MMERMIKVLERMESRLESIEKRQDQLADNLNILVAKLECPDGFLRLAGKVQADPELMNEFKNGSDSFECHIEGYEFQVSEALFMGLQGEPKKLQALFETGALESLRNALHNHERLEGLLNESDKELTKVRKQAKSTIKNLEKRIDSAIKSCNSVVLGKIEARIQDLDNKETSFQKALSKLNATMAEARAFVSERKNQDIAKNGFKGKSFSIR